MDAKFTLKAECIVENIDHRATSILELEKEIDKLFNYFGIITRVKVCDLSYIMKGMTNDV